MGGTMRLGADPVQLVEGTLAHARLRRVRRLRAPPPPLRGQQQRCARSSRRTAWSSRGTSPDGRLVEIIELPDHPWFCASQFHPEFKSRPNRPQPLFRDFVGAAVARRGRRPAEAVAVAENLTA